jgi:chromosomal replication initiation ATPase DnaA
VDVSIVTEQLSLQIIPRLSYSAENFVLHAGLQKIVASVAYSLTSNDYSLCWINGGHRSGKTHFSIYLSEQLIKLGLPGRLLIGQDLYAWLDSRFERPEVAQGEVLIVDDAQDFFLSDYALQSDAFVGLVEEMRNVNGKLIFLSSSHFSEFKCDAHTMSRLKAGHVFNIENPEESNIQAILFSMARQRGLALNDKRLNFVSKRMRRDIASIESYLGRVSLISNTLNKSVTRPLLNDAL